MTLQELNNLPTVLKIDTELEYLRNDKEIHGIFRCTDAKLLFLFKDRQKNWAGGASGDDLYPYYTRVPLCYLKYFKFEKQSDLTIISEEEIREMFNLKNNDIILIHLTSKLVDKYETRRS